MAFSTTSQESYTERNIATKIGKALPERKNKLTLYYSFFTRVQEKNETISQYYASLRLLAMECNFGVFRDDFVKIKVISGLYLRDSRQQLLEFMDLNLENIIDICTNIENSFLNNDEDINESSTECIEVLSNNNSACETCGAVIRGRGDRKQLFELQVQTVVDSDDSNSTKGNDFPFGEIVDTTVEHPARRVTEERGSNHRIGRDIQGLDIKETGNVEVHSAGKKDKCYRSKYSRSKYLPRGSIERYLCDICGKDLSRATQYKKHVLSHGDSSGEQRLYPCMVCQRTFKFSAHLKKHQAMHKDTPPLHHCKLCNKLFKSARSLHGHRLVHVEERPHKCDQCLKSFRTLTKLTVHKRVHTGEKPYTCHVCNKAFNRSNNLAIHERVHTGARPYVCDSCGKRFKTTSQLKKHYRVHTGERPYVCQLCNRGFNQSTHLKTHMVVHKEVKTME